jgi:CheY-like chemotaxis protein
MPDPLAVLVEDLPEQVRISEEVLQSAGFIVKTYTDFNSAQDYVRNTTDLVDLFVLDRRLPVTAGDPPADEVGDQLLQEVRECHPDARVIVFTGYTGVPHIQQALQGGGQLPSQTDQAIDRVTVLDKGQTLEFRQQVEDLRGLIQSLDDIEVDLGAVAAATGLEDRRCLRRLAFEYRAISVTAIPMVGGLTGASVWLCELSQARGVIARVVVKRVTKRGEPGGLPALLHPAHTAATVATISGLMGGHHLNVLQVGGSDPHSLMEVIGADPVKAVTLVRPIWDALAGVPSQEAHFSVAEICGPVISWQDLRDLLVPHSVVVPAGTLAATTAIGMRHGDLHPGNVLVDDNGVVLIDFDDTALAAGAIDPVTMLLSTLVHPDSPLRGAAWVSVDEIARTLGTPEFGQGHSHRDWFAGVLAWLEEMKRSDREFWAVVLAYAGRQLRYSDVTEDSDVLARVLAVARRASDCLADS